MRLTDLDKKYILEVFHTFSEAKSKIYLFGSRLDDSKKGGDIDLLIVFVSNEIKSKFKHLDFIIELKKKMGDRKMDVTLAHQAELETDVFLISIFDSAVQLLN